MTSSISDIFANDKVIMTSPVLYLLWLAVTTGRVDLVELSMWLQ